MSWTLSFQRELAPTTAPELCYLGTRGRKLLVQLWLNAGLVNESNLIIPTFFAEPTADQLAGLTTLGDVRRMPGTNTQALVSHLRHGEPERRIHSDDGGVRNGGQPRVQ